MSDRTEFPWILLKRLVGRTPATPIDVQEGQLRYDRDQSATTGHLYLARLKASALEWLDLTPGAAGPAPADATYLVQTANGTLTNEQAMGSLATGLVKNTTTTGVQSIAVAGTDYPKPGLGLFAAPGPTAIDAATPTVLVSQECAARYLGYTTSDVTGAKVNVVVATAAVTITWAEAALASAPAQSLALTTLATVDVSASFNSTGGKQVTFTVNIPAGTHVYFVAGSQATTPFQLRATLGSEFGGTAPFVGHKTLTRPSTMGGGTLFSSSALADYAAWVAARWT